MKIRLLHDLPIGSEHGATKGRIFEAKKCKRKAWFTGDTGKECAAFSFEYEMIDENKE